MVTLDKITGMLAGVMLGDLLGSPVEGMLRHEVVMKHGRITGMLPGSTTTDDWQLTSVVADALISSGLEMDAQAAAHVAAFEQGHARWGGNTKRAVLKLMHGYNWSQTGELLGIGNGVVMKLAPVAAFMATADGAERQQVERFTINLTRMTHATRLAVTASLVHLHALAWLLRITPEHFRRSAFINLVVAHAREAAFMAPPDPFQLDDLVQRLEQLPRYCRLTPNWIDRELRGDGYIWNSLPFVYAHFLRNPNSVDALYDAVSGGEDADTNGGLVGSLLGALSGTAVFSASLVEQVDPRLRQQAVDMAERLAAKVGVEAV